jgi:hypothetical protein
MFTLEIVEKCEAHCDTNTRFLQLLRFFSQTKVSRCDMVVVCVLLKYLFVKKVGTWMDSRLTIVSTPEIICP